MKWPWQWLRRERPARPAATPPAPMPEAAEQAEQAEAKLAEAQASALAIRHEVDQFLASVEAALARRRR